MSFAADKPVLYTKSLDQRLRDEDYFFIISGLRGKGVLLLDITNKHGRTSTIKIPNTWVPINLLDYANKDMLSDSVNLRGHLNKKTLIQVDSEWALSVLSTEEAIAEMDDQGIAINEPTGKVTSLNSDESVITHAGEAQNIVSDNVSPKIIAYCADLSDKKFDAGKASTRLLNLFSNEVLHKDSIEYIVSYFEEEGNANLLPTYEKVLSAAKSKLATM